MHYQCDHYQNDTDDVAAAAVGDDGDVGAPYLRCYELDVPPGSGLYGYCPYRPDVGPPLSVVFSELRRRSTKKQPLSIPCDGDGNADSVPLPPY